ncbi:MAG: hypothetical protein WKG07_26705 [Hymenobacter sp.]
MPTTPDPRPQNAGPSEPAPTRHLRRCSARRCCWAACWGLGPGRSGCSSPSCRP